MSIATVVRVTPVAIFLVDRVLGRAMIFSHAGNGGPSGRVVVGCMISQSKWA
jgi:hypothetical protein